MRASRLVSQVTFDPDRTAAAWRQSSPDFPADLDPQELLLLTMQHRLAGLVHDALVAADWLDYLPMTVVDQLTLGQRVARSRQHELYGAFQQLAEREPEVLSRAAVLKGATLHSLYLKPEHRAMSDFDILVDADDFATLEGHFEALGYWRKESLNGPTYYRESDNPSGRLCLDLHVLGPSKYYRPDDALTDEWLSTAVPFELAGVPCRRLAPDFEFVNVVAHAHEHLASWAHACADDDIRLIRQIDAELMVERGEVDLAGCWRRAVGLDLHGEFALGLWAWREIRGRLPAGFEPMTPLLDRLAEVGEACALPVGQMTRWSVPLAERAFRTDRLQLGLDLLPEPGPRRWGEWRQWYMTKGMLDGEREDVEAIAAEARRLMVGVEPVWER
jgi:Uncharacterised nucleotidyltransferase